VHHTGHVIVADVHHVQSVLETLLVHRALQSCKNTTLFTMFRYILRSLEDLIGGT
jgi:hypothetical protein